jgi:hypothetical protein
MQVAILLGVQDLEAVGDSQLVVRQVHAPLHAVWSSCSAMDVGPWRRLNHAVFYSTESPHCYGSVSQSAAGGYSCMA